MHTLYMAVEICFAMKAFSRNATIAAFNLTQSFFAVGFTLMASEIVARGETFLACNTIIRFRFQMTVNQITRANVSFILGEMGIGKAMYL